MFDVRHVRNESDEKQKRKELMTIVSPTLVSFRRLYKRINWAQLIIIRIVNYNNRFVRFFFFSFSLYYNLPSLRGYSFSLFFFKKKNIFFFFFFFFFFYLNFFFFFFF